MEEGSYSYRERKEASVANLHGTTMIELLLVSSSIPAGLWLLAEIKALKKVIYGPHDTCSLQLRKTVCAELLLVIFPALACMVWTTYGPVLLISVIITCLCCKLVLRGFLETSTQMRTQWVQGLTDRHSRLALKKTSALTAGRNTYVTLFRGSVMVMTCITILAVDFQVFPRRFAKTEVFGTGLMDLGVGATVFGSGLASGCNSRRRKSKTEGRPSANVLWATLGDSATEMFRSWPLAALGVSRVVVIKALGYPEHVSEYGVHWNFFATLFCIRILVALLRRLCSWKYHLVLAVSALSGYQVMLLLGLTDYVVNAKRDTVVSMNREGIFGLIGFLTIFYIAEEIGRQLSSQFASNIKENTNGRTVPARSFLTLVEVNFVLWVSTLVGASFIQDTSRRMMNLTYVSWVTAHCTTMLAGIILMDTISSWPIHSIVLSAFNLNTFPTFMIANIITGAVNISIRTLDVEDNKAVVLLSVYAVAVAVAAVFLARDRIELRC